MSPSYLAAVAAPVLALVLLRLAGVLPIRAASRPLGRPSAVVAFLGVLGLVGHCLAMFFPPLGRAVPGLAALVPAIDALGAASAALFVVPALLVLGGARRLHPVAVAVAAVALAAVGITMYDGGPVGVHLAAIAVAVVALAVAAFACTRSVGRGT